MMRNVILLALPVIATACGAKPETAKGFPADSIGAASDPLSMAQDSAVRADSVRAVQSAGASAQSKAGTTAGSTGTKSPQYIGRDSAFGPTFTVDSTGKVTPIIKPIVKKKP